MSCRSPQSEPLSACILKHVKNELVSFLVNDHLHKIVANGEFLFYFYKEIPIFY